MFEKFKKFLFSSLKKGYKKKDDDYDESPQSKNSKNLDKKNKIDESDDPHIFQKNWNNSLEDGFDWFSDRYQSLIVQRNIMIFLLIFSIISVVALGLTLFFLFKSKVIEPFIIEVDKKTGFVTFLKKDNKIVGYTENEAIRNYFIKKYLDARETLDIKNFNYFYNKVVPALSSQAVARQFNYLLRSNEKNNPFIIYENNIECKIIINSITEIGKNALQVRFIVESSFQDGRKLRINKIATINYEFVNYEMDEELRYINPLGFIVTNYRAIDENI